MNRIDTRKLTVCSLAMLGCLVAANVFGQTNANPELVAKLPDVGPNILYAMCGQMLNNPASLMVIAFLCVWNYLLDDLPWVKPRYVKLFSVLSGEAIYWMFTTAETVPRSFPHPMAVFVANGTLCGFVAYAIHRQATVRALNLFGQWQGEKAVNNNQQT